MKKTILSLIVAAGFVCSASAQSRGGAPDPIILYSVNETTAVPEPSQVAASLLLVAGIAGFVIVRRRKETALALAA